ncbi:hypothetical protein BJV82DRAFT_627738 [Fennellomyces sp. T-0311]|nr:hypothetical protein BJV82DRAFT_627738 [Fennellomyces sp. T-0311]
MNAKPIAEELPQQDSSMEVEQDNAAPGAWEITKGSRHKPTDDDQPEELSAEQQDEKTLEALNEMTSIMEELENDKTRYDLHVRLIELLQQVPMDDELDRARAQMHEIYPLSESMWLDWINDTKEKEDSEEREEKLLWLYEEANRDYFSIPIWNSFVDRVLEKFDNKFDDPEKVQAAREDLSRAARATEHHISQGQQIWSKYIEFETKVLKPFDSEESMQQELDPKQVERVKQLYRNRLDVLHTSAEETFNNFSTFNTTFDNANYEENMLQANKLYAKTQKAIEVRDQYELQLKQTNNALSTFYEYIEYERQTNDRFSLNNTRNLYERAVTIYCTDVGLWDNYITFLLERARFPVILEAISRRAVRNCPWSGALWAHYARSLEANNKDKAEVLEIFTKASAVEVLLTSLEDLVNLYLAKCDYLRRQVDWSNPREEDIVDLRLAFEEAFVYLHEKHPKTPDPYFRIERYYAFVENTLLDSEEKAREIWETRVIKKLGRSAEAWLAYIDFERSCGHLDKCQTLYKRAIVRNLDDPQRFTMAWLSFAREAGNLDMLQDTLVKVKSKENAIVHQWQEQAAEMEVASKAEEQKLIKQKKQKAQHRLKNKAKQKQKRDQEENDSQASKSEETTKEESQAKEPEDTVREDDDGFKMPAPVKRKASASNDSGITSPVAKRTRIDDLEEEQSSEDRGEASSSNRGRVLGRGGRGRGRGRGRLGLGFSAKKNTKEEPKEAGPSLPSESKPKSQDDFRAMLLGKK